MKFNRDVYRWGFVDRANDEIEVAHGLVEIIYKDGTVAEIEVEEIKHLVIHHRIPDEVKEG